MLYPCPHVDDSNPPPQIEKWCEDQYPSFVQMATGGQAQTFDSTDVRSSVAQILDDHQRKAWLERKRQELLGATGAVTPAREKGEEASTADTFKFVAVAFTIVTVVSLGSVYGVMLLLDHFS